MTILFSTCIQIHAQSFGKSLLRGVLNGVSEGIKQSSRQTQQRSSNSFSLENTHATPIQSGSSFSLANTSATVIKPQTIQFDDGSKFQGFISNGHADGYISYANGVFCKGVFDSSWKKDGKCYVRYPNGDWYYGYFSHGKEHGNGSFYTDGNYYDMTYNMGEATSATRVSTPKYNYPKEQAEYQAALSNYQTQMLEQQQSYEVNSSSSSSSSRGSNTTSSRTCGVCYGSGKCRTCNGKGYYTAIGIGSGTHACPNCRNHNGLCSSCNGTGRR